MTSEYGLVKSLLEQTKEESVRGLLFTEGHTGNVEVSWLKAVLERYVQPSVRWK